MTRRGASPAGDGVPGLVPPMMPSTTSAEPPTGPDWRVEVAWTGHRCIAYVHPDGRVRLLSGGDNSMTHSYPEIAGPLRARCPPGGMVLDGTIVARGEEHAPRARLLKRRHSRYKPSDQDIAAVPVDLQVADLLFFDGRSCVDLPYRDRRALLERLDLADAPVWTTALFPATELTSIMRIAAAKGVDAFHARHLGARYRPGGRSKFWLRVPVQRTRQVVVGGFTPTGPDRPGTVATLLLGVPAAGGRLRYVGRVGVGAEQRRLLEGDLIGAARAESPFTAPLPDGAGRHAVWVEPDLVGLVEFVGWVGGTRMRLPRWCGLADLGEVDDSQWAAPPLPEPDAEPPVVLRIQVPPGSEPEQDADGVRTTQHRALDRLRQELRADQAPEEAMPEAATDPASAAVEERRLEQHFVYNALNTIASLIRTDPSRARELLISFADLTRAADGPPESTLARELAAVRAYVALEQARFGARLQATFDVEPGTDGVAVRSLRLLAVVRRAVQAGIEPRREGGPLTVAVRTAPDGCAVTVTAADDEPVVVLLEAAGP